MGIMDWYYRTLGLYPNNLTAPLSYWHKGTAFQLDTVRANPEMQAVDAEMSTGIVMVSMAARTMQMLLSLAKALAYQRHWYWKWSPVAWMGKVARAVMWLCFGLLGSLVEMDSSISVRFFWIGLTKPPAQNTAPREEKGLRVIKLIQDMQLVTLNCSCDDQGFMEKMPHKEAILSSCTNPIILSMVYLPSDDEDALSTSEASELNELEVEGEQLWEDEEESCSTENNISTDSGMQELWTPGSKNDTEESDWSDEESDWSSEESDLSSEDSWDSDSDTESCKLNEDLWASFCRNDDPYNPLCFAMPTKTSQKTHEPKDITDVKDSSTGGSVAYSVLLGDSGAEAKKKNCRNPRVGKRKSPWVKDSSPSSVEVEQENADLLEPQKLETGFIKRVHFSPTVNVHHMVVWSYAYRMARKGPWEEYARDRCRFQRRIAEAEGVIRNFLQPQHREKIWTSLQGNNKE
ncbi:protein phosphatase 1 regulatory subunit 15B L homeolog isoform X1 [Xenopus laevis]|uniref:Protein phosphatase 1 regulatory subunit 15B L homeolog isoform X1 n=1 Tax=Xenopus laevis TaxID=8355 RepID=A0A8J1L4L6_XENLA|nr:protein phosphatase 1 regulatory subunit 15B L homeolog isoform X1 [Xenopus laevis]